MKTVVVVDEDSSLAEIFAYTLKDRGYEVVYCDEGDEASRASKETLAFAAFLNITAWGPKSLCALNDIRRHSPMTHVVAITDYSQNDIVTEALRAGCFVCMIKPIGSLDIIGILEILESGVDRMDRAA